MNFNDYQVVARSTAIYPNLNNNIFYPTLGLCGESGEVAEKVKKIIRDKGKIIDEKDRIEIRKELGDVLWYIANISSELDLELDEVAELNIAKLKERKDNNKLHGDGDNR